MTTLNKPALYIPQTRILDPRDTSLVPEAGALGFARGVVRQVNEAERTVELVISSGEVDRYGEIVDPKAFDAETVNGFMANPVMLAGHRHIGFNGEPTIVGHWLSIKREGNLTVGVAKLATTPLAQTYWQLILDGSLRACSIGFIVREWEMREVGAGKEKLRVRVFTKIELVEISLVAVPANREALLKAAGFEALAAAGDENHDTTTDAGAIKTLCASVDELKTALSAEAGTELHALIEHAAERVACAVLRGLRAGGVSEEPPDGTGGEDQGAREILDALERMLERIK